MYLYHSKFTDWDIWTNEESFPDNQKPCKIDLFPRVHTSQSGEPVVYKHAVACHRELYAPSCDPCIVYLNVMTQLKQNE